jgi:hypothetical protein
MRFRTAVQVACVVGLPATAQQPGTTAPVPPQFRQWEAIDYPAKIAKLCDTHIKNHRVQGTRASWSRESDPPLELRSSLLTQIDLCGEKAWLTVVGGRLSNGMEFDRVDYLTPADHYLLERLDRRHRLALKYYHTVWGDTFGWYGVSFQAFLACVQIYHPSTKEPLLSHESVSYAGRDALKLTTQRSTDTNTIYLAQDTYQLLAYEQSRIRRQGEAPSERWRTTVTYRDVGGKRFPSRVEVRTVLPDGSTWVAHETDIEEYYPYAPPPDELDLEKHYGVTPFTNVERPADIPWPPRAPDPGPKWKPTPGDPNAIVLPDDWIRAGVVIWVLLMVLIGVGIYIRCRRPRAGG